MRNASRGTRFGTIGYDAPIGVDSFWICGWVMISKGLPIERRGRAGGPLIANQSHLQNRPASG